MVIGTSSMDMLKSNQQHKTIKILRIYTLGAIMASSVILFGKCIIILISLFYPGNGKVGADLYGSNQKNAFSFRSVCIFLEDSRLYFPIKKG